MLTQKRVRGLFSYDRDTGHLHAISLFLAQAEDPELSPHISRFGSTVSRIEYRQLSGPMKWDRFLLVWSLIILMGLLDGEI